MRCDQAELFSRSINVKKAASVVAVVVVAVAVVLKWSSLIGNGQKAREKDDLKTTSKN